MIKRSIITIVALCSLHTTVSAKQSSSVSVIDDYKNWNWDNVHVAQNDYISLAIVPDAAGRMLEFNLADTPSLWLNPNLLGQSFPQNEEVNGTADWRNFGGFRLIPIPRDNVATNPNGANLATTARWPPPATLGDSPYQVSISEDNNGVKTIHAESNIQDLPVPSWNNSSNRYIYPNNVEEQIQYRRSLHIEDDSSLVFINHRLTNRGNQTVQRGIMTTSQHISRSRAELTDGENFLAYIPFDTSLRLPNGDQFSINVNPENRWNFVHRNRMPLDRNNQDHVAQFLNHGTNWNGEVSPGIYEIEYDYNLMGGFHIIAAKPWLAYVNKLNLTAFAKIFEPYDRNATYEYGINVSIYNSGLETGYLETEVKTPIYTLAAGESFDYQEIQAAAKILSIPVLDVNRAGIITTKLAFNNANNVLTGQYGVFKAGDLVVELLTSRESILSTIKVNPVSPLAGVDFRLTLPQNNSAVKARLFVKDTKGVKHLLDSVDLN